MADPTAPTPPPSTTTRVPSATAVDVVGAAPPRRVSWGAIFAGGLVALALQLLLNLLGAGVGLATLEPGGDAPGSGLAIGAIIWWALSGFAALFVGGAVAGRLAGSATHTDGALHGVAVWALSTVLAIYLVASSFGALVSTTLGAVGQGLSQAASVASSNLPSLESEIDRRIAIDGETWQEVETELREMLRQTGKEELQPENIESSVEGAVATTRRNAEDAAARPGQMDHELRSTIRRVTRVGGDLVNAADEEAAVNLLVARTDMTQTEAQATIDRWQAQFDDASERLQALVEDAKSAGMEVVDETGDAAAGMAFQAFFVLLIGAVAAGIGGATGAPEDRIAARNLNAR